MSENTEPADEAAIEEEAAIGEEIEHAEGEEGVEGDAGAVDGVEGVAGTSGSESDVLFRQLLEVLLAKMDDGIDNLLGVQEAIQRFGAMGTLLTMHMLMDAVRESAPGQVPNIEPLALKWIEDNARSYAEGLMNQEVIAATSKVVGSPPLTLHFGRAFRRRILGYN